MYKKILVPLDGSQPAECVLPHVESIAKGCGVQDVILLRVVEPFRHFCDYDGCVSEETINSIDTVMRKSIFRGKADKFLAIIS